MPDQPIALNLARILLRILLDPRGWRIDLLQSELGIAERTWRKYRSLLKDHLEHRIDPDGEWHIAEVPEGNARYLRLTADHGELEHREGFRARLAALWLTRKMFEFAGKGELRDAVEDEWTDLREGFGDRQLWLGHHMLRNTDRLLHFVPDAPKDYSGHEQAIATLLRGLFHRRRVRFGYPRGKDGTVRAQVVCPLTVVMWRSALYLVAVHGPGKQPYVYAIDRMVDVGSEGKRFEYPSEGDYHPERLFEGSFGIWQDPHGKPTLVELRFEPEPWLHRYLSERTWHPSQRFEELDDGRLRMTFTVTSTVEVLPWVRSFGDAVEVVRPPMT